MAPRKRLVDKLKAKDHATKNGKPKAPPLGAATPEQQQYDPEPDLDLGTLLSTVKPERVSWLWLPRIPLGKLTILDGDPGLGKSVLTLTLAALVTRGAPMPFADREPGVDPEPAGVVLLSAEDGLDDTIRPRLDAAGADAARVLALDRIPDGAGHRLPVLPADANYIRLAVRRVEAKLVIIDPLTAFLGSDTNAHKDQDCRRALHPLAVVAQETGAAVVVVRHLNKAAGGNPLYRGGGSIGIIGAARSGLLVARDPDNPDRRILASTKCNLAKLPASLSFDLSTADNGALRIGWIGASAHTAESLLAAPRDDEDAGAVQEAVEVLRSILESGPVPSEDVKKEARKAGISERTLHRAKTILDVKSRKLSFTGKGVWQWSLPCHTP
jgi:AAA domain